MTLYNPPSPIFDEIDGTQANNQFTIAAGADGWIDTDISASDVVFGSTCLIWVAVPAGANWIGARRPGSGGSVTHQTSTTINCFSGMSSAKHVELYRNAGAGTTFKLVGALR